MRIKENCPECHNRTIYTYKHLGDLVTMPDESQLHEKIFQCQDCGCKIALLETWADLKRYELDKADTDDPEQVNKVGTGDPEQVNKVGTGEPSTVFCYGCFRVSEYTMPQPRKQAHCPHCGIYYSHNETLRKRYQERTGKLHELDTIYRGSEGG